MTEKMRETDDKREQKAFIHLFHFKIFADVQKVQKYIE